MKKDIMNRIILSTLLLLSGYFIGFVSSDCSSASHHEVEYRIVGLNHLSETSELEDELNKMGVDGWELVQFGKYMAIFKR